jgi:GNAT superfamily N-acetyltransferase
MTEIIITNTRPEHAEAIEAHQRLCFPTLLEEDLMRAVHVRRHLEVFPAGQHVALDGERVVGMSSTFRATTEQAFTPHDFHTIIDGGFFGFHNPHGEWLYGVDVSVHPEYRGRKISKMLYDARKQLIRQLGMRGMVAGGMLPGFYLYKDTLTVEQYVAAVVAGDMIDPTLTAQLKSGFVVHSIMDNYLEAGHLGNQAALIVWENADAANP